MTCERSFQFLAEDVRSAVAADRALEELPELRAFKESVVDSRKWDCFVCGGLHGVENVTWIALPELPKGDTKISLFVMCYPRCGNPACVEETADAIERGKQAIAKSTVGVALGTKERVRVSFWGAQGVAHTHRPLITTGDLSSRIRAILTFQHLVDSWHVAPSGRRESRWDCASCGAAASAYSLAVSEDQADEGPDPIRWAVDVFPYCEDDQCRQRAVAAARELAGDGPEGFAEGSVCAWCPSFSTDGTRGMQRCGRCKPIRYCSAECQRAHWPENKAACAPKDGK
ncbi:hypothetical protein DFJ74DRAFT_684809 [Hyaloraphidium curvatum]|nr:hypothetical protein DFJ74DRAFT_684809 [Hyaloraphidium curvatum]